MCEFVRERQRKEGESTSLGEWSYHNFFFSGDLKPAGIIGTRVPDMFVKQPGLGLKLRGWPGCLNRQATKPAICLIVNNLNLKSHTSLVTIVLDSAATEHIQIQT